MAFKERRNNIMHSYTNITEHNLDTKKYDCKTEQCAYIQDRHSRLIKWNNNNSLFLNINLYKDIGEVFNENVKDRLLRMI